MPLWARCGCLSIGLEKREERKSTWEEEVLAAAAKQPAENGRAVSGKKMEKASEAR